MRHILIGLAGILLTGFFAFINLAEWYSIAIMKQVDGFPFGVEGPSPYYDRTPSLYAAVTFIWGLLFLLNLSYLIWSMVKRRKRSTIVGCGVSIMLLLVMFIHGQIGAE